MNSFLGKFRGILFRSRNFISTGALYLVPRFMPLGLVAILTIQGGIEGLGEAALTLSLWQFFLVVNDFGVSQWLLTKISLTKRETLEALIGRLFVGLFSALVVGLLYQTNLLPISREGALILAICLSLSVGQMAFSWYIQREARTVAAVVVFLEFVLPLLTLIFVESPLLGLFSVMVAKTGIALILTTLAVMTLRHSEHPQGLSPKAFGIHSSAWGLTSVASGTGELMLIGSLGNAAISGIYRILQTIASLGSTVGFAALAPLMSRRGDASKRIWPGMTVLGGISALLVVSGMTLGILMSTQSAEGYIGWTLVAASSLAGTAVLNTMAVVPMSEVARLHGTKYTLIIGLVTSAVYWILILVFFASALPFLAPLSVLLAACVGFIGNLIVYSRIRTDNAASTNVELDVTPKQENRH